MDSSREIRSPLPSSQSTSTVKGREGESSALGWGFFAIGYTAELCVGTRYRWVNDWIGLLKKGEYFELFLVSRY